MSESVRDITMVDAQEKIRIAMLKILNTNSLRLFGCMIYNFEIHILKTPNDVPEKYLPFLTAFVKLINSKPHVYVYDTFIAQNDHDELVFVILHEMIHSIAGHFYRGKGFNRVLFGRACDHVINCPLDRDIKAGRLPRNIKTPESAFIIEELYDRNMTEEEVYAFLEKKARVTKIFFPSALSGSQNGNLDNRSGSSAEKGGKGESTRGHQGSDQGEKGSRSPDQETAKDNVGNVEFEIYEVEINGTVHTIVEFPEIMPGAKHKELSDRLKAEARAISATLDQLRGTSSGHFSEYIDSLIKVELSWDEILEKAILTKVVPDTENRTWRNPNKKLRQYLMFPGKAFAPKAATLFIALDTSASISKDDISHFLGVVEDSLIHFDRVRVVKHDVGIQDDRTYSSDQFVGASSLEGLFEVNGRGGTSHRYVFDLFEQALEEDEEISLVILLTDFYSDIEEIWDAYEWHQYYPLIVGVCGDRQIPNFIDKNPVKIT